MKTSGEELMASAEREFNMGVWGWAEVKPHEAETFAYSY